MNTYVYDTLQILYKGFYNGNIEQYIFASENTI